MKKMLSLMLFMGAMFVFSACDEDPKEGDAKAVYTIFVEANDVAKDNFKLVVNCSGNSASMTHIDLNGIDENDDYMKSGKKLEGKISNTGSYVTVLLQLEKKETIKDLEKYTMNVLMYANVVTYDANGNTTQTKKVYATNILNNQTFTKKEFNEKFLGKQTYSMDLSVKVDTQGNISIEKGKTSI